MADDLHEVVKLLLARMESHPDEFASDLSVSVGESRADRWWQAIRLVNDCGTKKEKDAINQGIRKIKLQRAHEMVMDELLNGDERRRKFEEEQEYEANLLKNARNNMGAALNAAPHPFGPSYDAVTDTYKYKSQGLTMRVPKTADMENNGIMNALRKAFK